MNTRTLQSTRLDSIDSVERICADLDDGPELDPHWRAHYVRGGFPKAGPPATHDIVEGRVGKDVHGAPIYGLKTVSRSKDLNRQGEEPPPMENSSREATLGLVRAFRTAGWSKDATRTMMGRQLARGTAWLLWFRDFDEEFERCWSKAGIHPREFTKPKPRREFVSRVIVQELVFTVIEVLAEVGKPVTHTDLYRLGKGSKVVGRNYKGQIDAALESLTVDGFISYEIGGRTNRMKLYRALPLTPVESEDDDGLIELDEGQLDQLARDMAPMLRDLDETRGFISSYGRLHTPFGRYGTLRNRGR